MWVKTRQSHGSYEFLFCCFLFSGLDFAFVFVFVVVVVVVPVVAVVTVVVVVVVVVVVAVVVSWKSKATPPQCNFPQEIRLIY